MCPVIKTSTINNISANNEVVTPEASGKILKRENSSQLSINNEPVIARAKSQSSIQEIEKDVKSLENKTVKLGLFDRFVDSVKSFFAPKEKLVSEGINGTLKVPDGVQPEVAVNPGVKSKITKDVEIDGVKFKKGDVCEAFEKDGKIFIHKMKVEKKNGNDELSIDKSVKEVSTTDKSLVKIEFSFKKTDKPLFENPPLVSDIKQGAIGDCYLIAGLSAITQKDPSQIYNLIKDNGNGTVTVKLFRKDENDELKPKFITFEKSVSNSPGKASDSLWVQMLEKAYAIEKGGFESIGGGGHVNEVFETFLGKNATKSEIKPMVIGDTLKAIPLYSITNEKFEQIQNKMTEKGVPISDEQVQKLRPLIGKGYNDISDIKRSLGESLGIDPNSPENSKLLTKLRDSFLNEDKLAFMGLLDQSKTYKDIGNSSKGKDNDFKKFVSEIKELVNTDQPQITVKGKTISTEVAKEFVAKIEKEGNGRFSGEVGSGQYSKDQKDLFKNIKDALAEGRYVAMGTHVDLGKANRVGHSAGESVVDGLVGQHAYAISDVVEMNGRMFVKVANPWGSTSRDYTANEDGSLKAREFSKSNYGYLPKNSSSLKDTGESWIELGDLTKNYKDLYLTNER